MADQSVSPQQFYTTLHEYLRQVQDHTIRSQLIPNRLAQKKTISFNHSGDWCQWPIQIGLPEVHPYTGGQLEFPESDKYREAHLKWRMFYCADSMDELSREQNKGEPALIRSQDKIAGDIRKSLQMKLNSSFYFDGEVETGYPHGLETFLGVKAGTVVGDRIAQVDDDYAGITTDLATEGGSWDAAGATPLNTTLGYSWPEGEGDSEYDCYAPKLANVGSTAWASGLNGVEDNLEECISAVAMWITLLGGQEARPDLCILSQDWWRTYETIQRAKMVINVPHTPSQDLGFTGFGFNQDGVYVTTDYGVPAARAYLVNTGSIELRSMKPQLFSVKGPADVIQSLSMLLAAYFMGQWAFDPKNVGKIFAYASS